MKFVLGGLGFFFFTGLLWARSEGNVPAPPSPEPAPAKSSVEAVSDVAKKTKQALPMPKPGTEFLRLRMPRYEQSRLVAFMTADSALVADADHILGKNVLARLYKKEGGELLLQLGDAQYHLPSGFLRSESQMTLLDARFKTEGQKVALDMQKQKGFIFGPVRSTMEPTQGKASVQ